VQKGATFVTPCDTCVVKANTDDNEGSRNDLARVSAPSSSKCAKECSRKQGCTYAILFGQKCYLKKGKGTQHPQNGATFVTPCDRDVPPRDRCVVKANTDDNEGPRNDLAQVSAPSSSKCANECSRKQGCTYAIHFGQTCYLKKGKGTLRVQNGAIFVTPCDQDVTPCVVKANTNDNAGSRNELATVSTPSSSKCAERCSYKQGCDYAIYVGQTCFLKTGKKTLRAMKGYTYVTPC